MKKAKLFKNGESQAVRLPKEFRLPGKEVFIKRQGDMIILIPTNKSRYDRLTEIVAGFSDDFMNDGRERDVPNSKREAF